MVGGKDLLLTLFDELMNQLLISGPWPVNRVVRGLDGNAKLCKLYFLFHFYVTLG